VSPHAQHSITVFRAESIEAGADLPHLLRCAPLLRHVEVPTLYCCLGEGVALQTLEALRSLPQSLMWGKLDLCLESPHAQSIVLEVCAALDGTPLALAVSQLELNCWELEAPITALRALFPNVRHFELQFVEP